MSDIIRLLPDSVANQIAAGEVVQRPASAVKELLENTIDAGATDVRLVVKEAGKMLVQVTDNGCGMSEQDARMCFERHATSKISKADDLLAIRTLGFRGEALASIASIAQVELKTKRVEDEVGTAVTIEGTEFKGQVPVSCPNGTSISVKNIFFNVPARRNFLKSNTLELKYVIEEFTRVAMVNPSVSFTFFNQEKILYQLPPGNLKQRITAIFGASYSQRLIPVEQHSAIVNISGYIGKPEYAKKTRGEQYFFTNGRYIRSSYLNHAVESVFRELISADAFPSYFIFMEVDPQTIDVNIHPTKTEINFQDIKSIYGILYAAVKQSIGRFCLTPILDFDTEQSLVPPLFPADRPVRQPGITINPEFNPFEKKTEPQGSFTFTKPQTPSIAGWKDLYTTGDPSGVPPAPALISPESSREADSATDDQTAPAQKQGAQVNNAFLITHTWSGIMIIDQQHAHERILYERLLEQNRQGTAPGQRRLITETITLNPGDAGLLTEWKQHFCDLGFEIDDFGKDSFIIHAVPAYPETENAGALIESVLESLKSPGQVHNSEKRLAIAKAMAKKLSVKRGKKLHQEEIDSIIENLIACQVPALSPDGKPTMLIISWEELQAKLKI